MISAQHVSYRYPGGTEYALQDVSAHVEQGEVVGIVGPNGSGKSTLGRLMKGLLLPSAGIICVDGLDTRLGGLEVRRVVGLVFQNPNSQIVNAVVEQEVAFGLENMGVPPAEIRQRVSSALKAVGLIGQEMEECYKLSMADKQRVALAAVIAMEPSYLILDEPTAWIEPSARGPLIDEVLGWGAHREVGIVLVTHRMDEAQACSRLYGMLDGRVEAEGTPEDLFENKDIRSRLALEVPETFELAADLRAAGVPVPRGASIDRLADSIVGS
ncbi:MAG TPA: ATP-binding cassette domain-containing protein [Chloroflexota bacterium]